MATVRWKGTAVAVAQQTTLTFTGSFATSNTVTVTCNGNDLVVTLGATSAASVTAVASAVAAAINAATATAGITADETRNLGGQQIPEFTEFTATSSVGVVTLTGNTRGKPFTVTATETAAGAVSVATTVAATGPNHADNADNWGGGSLPGANDVMLFDSGSVSVLYGLGYFVTNTIATSIEITTDYTGQIGLPVYDVASGYAEYRDRYFKVYNAGVNSNYIRFTRGVQGLTNHQDIRLYCGGAAAAWTDLSSFAVRGATSGKPNVFVRGGTFDELVLVAGRIELDPSEAQGLSGNTTSELRILVGSSNSTEESYLICNQWTDLDACEEIRVVGGTAYFRCDVDYGGVGTDSFDVHGGTVYLEPPSGGLQLRDMVVRGGTLFPNHDSGSGSKLTVYSGGTVDMRRSALNRDYDAVVLYAGATYYDPDGLGTDVINLVGCDLSDVTLSIQPNRKLTLTAAAT
jgi:hypothetical protein